jgi:calmodulin
LQEKFELTLEDFKQLLEESWTSVNNDRYALRKALEKFDHSKEGFIDIEQFRIAMRTLGEPLSDDEIDGIIQIGLNDEHRKIDIECKFFY